jgi:hypothetical protein
VIANTISMAKNIYESVLNCQEGRSFEMVDRTSGYKGPNKVALQNSVVHHFYKDYIKTTALPNNEEFITKTGPMYSCGIKSSFYIKRCLGTNGRRF